MAELDQQFIEYVVKNLVDHPDDVKIERTIDDRGVLLELTVNEEDMGRIIGKAGSTAKAIRTLLRVVGAKTDERLNLKIVDIGGDGDDAHDEGSADAAVDEPEVDESPVETEGEPAPAESEETSMGEEAAEQERVAEVQTAEPTAQEASLEDFGADEEDLHPTDEAVSDDAPKDDVEAVKAKTRKEVEDLDLDL